MHRESPATPFSGHVRHLVEGSVTPPSPVSALLTKLDAVNGAAFGQTQISALHRDRLTSMNDH